MMTWGEFKELVEENGQVSDDLEIDMIDIDSAEGDIEIVVADEGVHISCRDAREYGREKAYVPIPKKTHTMTREEISERLKEGHGYGKLFIDEDATVRNDYNFEDLYREFSAVE